MAFGALGIALGRWLPTGAVGPPVALLVGWVASLSALPWVVQRQPSDPADGLHGHGGWNLAFLAGVTLAAGAAALSRDGRSAARTLLGVLGLAVAVAGFVLGGPYTGPR